MHIIAVCFFLLLTLVSVSAAKADLQSDVANLFDQNFATLDFARVKFEADLIVDPSTDVEAELARIDEMVSVIDNALDKDADDRSKVEAIKHFLYRPGWWNEGREFSYDHDDPFGQNPNNRLLSDYMEDRRGNCITMPFLIVILGQRLGLDMAPALGPLHVLVKFTDEDSVTHNLEATSGGGFVSDAYYRKILPITDRAIETGIFLRPLNNEEAIAVIASIVVEHLMQDGRYREAIDVSDILLSHYPDFAYLLAKRGTAAYYLLKKNFHDKYPTAQDVPQSQRAVLAHWQRINQRSFDKADGLGWMPMNLDSPLPAQ